MLAKEGNETALPNDDDIIEFRLSDLLLFIKKSRRFMGIGALIGALIGGIYAFSKPNEYTSQITVLPEVSNKGSANLGNLGSLAGLAGIDVSNIGAGSDAIRPDLYPNVLQSVPFSLHLLKQPVYVGKIERTQLLNSYLNETNQPSLFSRLFSISTGAKNTEINVADTNRALRITQEQESLLKIINERVSGNFEKKTGVLTLSSVMNDPIVAADVANHALSYLTDYVTSYRTEKARREVDFLSKQVSSAKQRYQQAEYELSAYRDRNRSLFLNTAKIEEQRIQAEFLLAQDLYNMLSKQSEMAKIKVQEDTPVFKVMDPARIPTHKSGPKRTNYIIGFAILGILFGLIVQYLKQH